MSIAASTMRSRGSRFTSAGSNLLVKGLVNLLRSTDAPPSRNSSLSCDLASGSSVKVCQELARHSDPKLTMNVYTHLGVKDRAAALEGLPDTTGVGLEREAAKATETYDAVAEAEITPTAHSTARRGHERPKLAPTRQRSVLDVAHDSGIQSPLVVSTCQHVARPDNSNARVAQLDRASVYGTEGYRFESCRACFCKNIRSCCNRMADMGIL